MTDHLFLACENGVVHAGRDGEVWRELGRGLAGRRVTSVIAREGVVLAGTHEGVWRSDDLGATWREASAGMSVHYVRWLAYHPEISDREFAGTEPAAIFVSDDGARTWHECDEVAVLRAEHRWSLPYSPGAGCVRGFAYHADRAYAAVEVGGVLRSDDGGSTWRLAAGSDGKPSFTAPAAPLVDSDVHSVLTHPSSPDMVFAATGNGFYRSSDGGQTWACLYRCYCRAAWVDPAAAAHIILGPASGVDRDGRIEELRDGGQTWQPLNAGLATPWPDHMVERFVPVDAGLLAVLSSGEVWAWPVLGDPWRPMLPDVEGVSAAHWMPD